MASPLFAKHAPQPAPAEEIEFVQRMAKSMSPDQSGPIFDKHVKVLQAVIATIAERQSDDESSGAVKKRLDKWSGWDRCVEIQEEAMPDIKMFEEAMRAMTSFAKNIMLVGKLPTNDEEAEAFADMWRMLLAAFDDLPFKKLLLPVLQNGALVPVELDGLGLVMVFAEISNGMIPPQLLLGMMAQFDVCRVLLANTALTFVDVATECASMGQQNDDAGQAAALHLMIADATYMAGRPRESATSLIRALDFEKNEPYIWMTLAEVLDEIGTAPMASAPEGTVTAAYARERAHKAVQSQRVGFQASWLQVALVVGTIGIAAVSIAALIRKRRSTAA